MKKKDCKLEDYKVKMYGKPVIGKSYSEENAVLFEDKKEEQGKDMKKHKNLTSADSYFVSIIFLLLVAISIVIGMTFNTLSFFQNIGCILMLPMIYFYIRFFKKRKEEESEENGK